MAYKKIITLARRILEIYLLFYLIVFTGYRSQLSNPAVARILFIILAVLIMAWLGYMLIARRPLHWPAVGAAGILFIISLATSAIHAVNIPLAVNELIILLLAGILFIGIYNLALYSNNTSLLTDELLITGSIYLILKTAQVIIMIPQRVNSCNKFLMAPNKTAAVAAFMLLLALAAFITRRGTWRLFVAILAGWILVISGSRGGMVGAAAGFIVLLVYYRRKEVIKLSEAQAVAVAVLTVVTLVFCIAALRPPHCTDLITGIQADAVNSSWTGSISRRGDLMKAAAAVILQRPLLGVGPGNLVYVLRPLFPAEISTPHAHNLYLQIVAERGIIGGGALLGLAAVIISLLIHSKDPAAAGPALAVLAAVMIHGIADVTTIEPVVLYFMLGILAVSLAAARIAGNGPALQLDPKEKMKQ